MTDFKPSVDTTIFPRRNFLQTRTERLLNRMAGGRVYQEIDKHFNRASLDLQFANSKSLTDSKSGKNLVTHTRASSATYVDRDGVIKNAATNTPRFDHNPATDESLGLLVEEARRTF